MMGVANSDSFGESHLHDVRREVSRQRTKLKGSIHHLLQRVSYHALDVLDAAADQHVVKSFILCRLPVVLSVGEERRTASGAPNVKIFPFSKLRIIRPGIARAVVEDGMVVVYHCMDNPRCGLSPLVEGSGFQPLEFDLDDGPAIEALLNSYPDSTMVSDLPHPSEELEDKVDVASALYKEGILYVDDQVTLPFDRMATAAVGGVKHGTLVDDDDDPF